MIKLSPEDRTSSLICRFRLGCEALIFRGMEALFQTKRYIDE
jgi:hypothetical protein